MRFCTVFEGASCVLGLGWESTFAELFVFALGGPTAPTGVEQGSCGSPMQGSGKAHQVGSGLGKGLVAECLTSISLLEKSK